MGRRTEEPRELGAGCAVAPTPLRSPTPGTSTPEQLGAEQPHWEGEIFKKTRIEVNCTLPQCGAGLKACPTHSPGVNPGEKALDIPYIFHQVLPSLKCK